MATKKQASKPTPKRAAVEPTDDSTDVELAGDDGDAMDEEPGPDDPAVEDAPVAPNQHDGAHGPVLPDLGNSLQSQIVTIDGIDYDMVTTPDTVIAAARKAVEEGDE